MFWLLLILKFVGVFLLAIILTCLILYIAYLFTRMAALLLVVVLLEAKHFCKFGKSISKKPCDNHNEADERSIITNLSIGINQIIDEHSLLFGIIRSTGLGSIPSRYIQCLCKQSTYGNNQNRDKDMVDMPPHPTYKGILKPITKVFQCFHLKRLYHKIKGQSTKMQKNPVGEKEKDAKVKD